MVSLKNLRSKSYSNGIRNGYGGSGNYVYFASVVIANTPLIKIGSWNGDYNIAGKLKSRYKAQFQIIKVVDGSSYSEEQIHKQFAYINTPVEYYPSKAVRSCKSAEFFKETKELRDFIDLLK